MGIEIERKFLVVGEQWRDQVYRRSPMAQGYLGGGGAASVRVRLAGSQAWLNVKSANPGMSRLEFEYAIPVADARTMLQRLCDQAAVEKTRYWVRNGESVWEIDVFEGANLGLVTAEIELSHEQQEFERPDWLGPEVTEEARYYNMNLAANPYKLWSR